MTTAHPNAKLHDTMVEMENPGEMRGTLKIQDDVPVLYSGDVGYDVTLKVDSLIDVMALVDQDVIATTERVQNAGMAAPQYGHVVVTAIRAA